MHAITMAFSVAFLAHVAQLRETAMARTPGDRYLFLAIAARIYLSHNNRRPISAAKLTADAEACGLSARTAIRMCREMVDGGLLVEQSAGKAKYLQPTDALVKMWEAHITEFTNELSRAGVKITLTE